jgi:hypothetical protein
MHALHVRTLTGAEMVAEEVGVEKVEEGLVMVVVEGGMVAVGREVGEAKEVEREGVAMEVKVEACTVRQGRKVGTKDALPSSEMQVCMCIVRTNTFASTQQHHSCCMQDTPCCAVVCDRVSCESSQLKLQQAKQQQLSKKLLPAKSCCQQLLTRLGAVQSSLRCGISCPARHSWWSVLPSSL